VLDADVYEVQDRRSFKIWEWPFLKKPSEGRSCFLGALFTHPTTYWSMAETSKLQRGFPPDIRKGVGGREQIAKAFHMSAK
jgi:hypothetical protein